MALEENVWPDLQSTAEEDDAPEQEEEESSPPEQSSEEVSAPEPPPDFWQLPKDPALLRQVLKELDEKEPVFREHARDIASRRVKAEAEDRELRMRQQLEQERLAREAAETERIRRDQESFESRRQRYAGAMEQLRQTQNPQEELIRLQAKSPQFRADHEFFSKTENQRAPSLDERLIESRITQAFADARTEGLPKEYLDELWRTRAEARQLAGGTAVGEYDLVRKRLAEDVQRYKAWQAQQNQDEFPAAAPAAPAETVTTPPQVNRNLASAPKPEMSPRNGTTVPGKQKHADLAKLRGDEIRRRFKTLEDYERALDEAI